MVKKILYGLLKKFKFLPQKTFIKIYYEYYSGKKLDLDNPVEFYEKISWYKVFFRPKILNTLADKYEVRKFIEVNIGKQYLNELYGVYDNPEDIDFDSLPNEFIIKANHTNGHNLIVNNKGSLDKQKVIKLFRKWLGKNQYYRRGQEWAYKDIEPKIIIEKFLKEDNKSDLVDYKYYCFDGKAEFINVHLDRTNDHKQGFFDLDFNLLPFGKNSNYKSISSGIEKPSNLDEMTKLSETLARNLPFVRVDFYSINGKSIFGEMTFYPGDARKSFYPEEYNNIIGDYFKLPKLNSKKETITSQEAIKY